MPVRTVEHDWKAMTFSKVHVLPPTQPGDGPTVIMDSDEVPEPMIVCGTCGCGLDQLEVNCPGDVDD